MEKKNEKVFLFLILIFFNFIVYAQSIGDYSLIHIPSGKIINIYDSAESFFDYIGEKQDLFNIQLTNISGNKKSGLQTFNGEFWEIMVQRIDYNLSLGEKSWMLSEGSLHPETDFNILSLIVSKDFMTIRDIKIGNNIQHVIEKYPSIQGYKRPLNFYDVEELRENNIDLSKQNNSLSDVKCLILCEHFFHLERAENCRPSFHYYLVFNLDDKQKVSEIKMFIIPDDV